MKRGIVVTILCMVVISVLCMSLFLTLGCGEKQVNQPKTQQDIVNDIISRLIKQGIPIKSANVTSSLPLDIDVVIQSASTDDKSLPDDILYLHTIEREVFLGKKHYSLDIQSLTMTLVNSEGKQLYGESDPVNRFTGDIIPSKLEETTMTELRYTIENFAGQMTLSKLENTYDYYGMPWIMIDLQVKDIEEANRLLRECMQNLRSEIETLNMQQTRIAVYEVTVYKAGGKLIFQDVNDLQIHEERWWQADGLDTIVGSHGPPSIPPINENTPAGEFR